MAKWPPHLIAWATVFPDGTFNNGAGIESIAHPSTGVYQIVPKDVDKWSAATFAARMIMHVNPIGGLAQDIAIGNIATNSSPRYFTFTIFNSSPAPVDNGFWCVLYVMRRTF